MALAVNSEKLRRSPTPAATDPNVRIPRSVVAAGARSEAIQREVFGIPAEAPPADPAAPPATPPATPPTETPPADPAAPPATPPATPPTETPPADPAAPPGTPPTALPTVDWERQFHSLQGRYDQQREVINDLSRRIDQMQAAPPASVVPPAAPQPIELPLTEQEISDYGPEFVDILKRVAAHVAAPLQTEIAGLKAQMGNVAKETNASALNRRATALNTLLPGVDWRGINDTSEFIAWTELPDVFSGVMRRNLLQEAWNDGNANRVAAFFRAYLDEVAATDPPRYAALTRQVPRPQSPPAPALPVPAAPAAPAPVPVLPLEHLAAPGRAHSAGPTTTEKRTYTPADITKFYTMSAAGYYRGKEAERVAIEADIMAAQHDGRLIVPQSGFRPQSGFSR